MRRAFAAIAVVGSLVAVLASTVSAQINAPVPAPSGPVNPAIPAGGVPVATPSPEPSPGPGESAPPEAPAHMVVDDSRRLHPRVDDYRAYELEAAFLQRR